MLQIETQMDK